MRVGSYYVGYSLWVTLSHRVRVISIELMTRSAKNWHYTHKDTQA